MDWSDRAAELNGAVQNTPKFLVRHRGTVKVVLIISGRIWAGRDDILTIKAARRSL
jgi:hypothetical protein